MRWRMTAAGQFYDAGESTVVMFDATSGDTHLISDFAATLLRSLAKSALSTEELAAAIAPLLDSNADDRGEIATAVRTVLEELRALDIVCAE